MGITARMFEVGLDNEDGVGFRDCTEMTRERIVELAQQSAQNFIKRWENSLSCFELNGDTGLWARLHAAIENRGIVPEVAEAVQKGDASGYMKSILLAQERAYADLWSRGVLDRLKIVDEIPEAAAHEFEALGIIANRSKQAQASARVSASVPVEPKLTRLEQCVLDYSGDKSKNIKPVSADIFRRTWVTHRINRAVYDRAVADGLI